MGLLNLLGRAMTIKANKIGGSAPVVRKTTVPNGMHQGSFVTLPDLDLALAAADGSIIKAVNGTRQIIAVGEYQLWGHDTYNLYLDGGIPSYIRLFCDKNGKPTEAMLWTNHAELLPQSKNDWEFWLGTYKSDGQGDYARDKFGNAIKNYDGAIGWPLFQIDGPTAIQYSRVWNSTAENATVGIDPLTFKEYMTDSAGQQVIISHTAMEYSRNLTAVINPTVEYLHTSVVEEPEGTSINVLVGIKINLGDLLSGVVQA